MTKPVSPPPLNTAFLPSPEVNSALATHDPIVAFETTVLSFGLPWPSNYQLGQRCEEIARQLGCTPATLGMIGGKVHLGLTPEQLESFCRPGADVTKVNLQNMSAALLSHKHGAFTVAATAQICSLAGIRTFATGGIGGVHRDFAQSHDVSSDLIALARYPVAVVCAGVKSILDVPATLEYLETLGVPVIAYKAENFPLFHACKSTIPCEIRTDDINEVAAMCQAHWNLGGRGVLVVTPVPEQHAVEPYELEEWINQATRAAQTGRVHGKAVTPFLLKKLEEVSKGKSITTNMALLENNTQTAAALASALASLPETDA